MGCIWLWIFPGRIIHFLSDVFSTMGCANLAGIRNTNYKIFSGFSPTQEGGRRGGFIGLSQFRVGDARFSANGARLHESVDRLRRVPSYRRDIRVTIWFHRHSTLRGYP